MRRMLAVVAVFSVLTLTMACSSSGDDGEAAGRDESGSEADEGGDGDMTVDDLDLEDDEGSAEELDIEDVIENVQEYWADNADELGGTVYEPVPDDRISALPSEDEDTILCGGQVLTAEEAAGNALAYRCLPEGSAVVWDPDFVDDLTEEHGVVAPGVVVAHEWGHVMQTQSGVLDLTRPEADPPSVFTENQADCYAGAWVAQQVEDGFGPFGDPSSLDNSIAAMLDLRDAPGSDPNDPLAHGSGFDRVRAFQDGVQQGPGYCYGYVDNPPFIEQLPFTEADLETEGNLPFDDAVELSIIELESYYAGAVDGFESPGDPFDLVDEDEVEDLHEDIGDGAVLALFGLLWGEQAQAAAGDELDGIGPLLQRACLVGAWLGDILQDQQDGVDRESGIALSPGDLDETIMTFLQLTEEAMSEEGVAFEAITDMRQGVFGGIEDCRLGE